MKSINKEVINKLESREDKSFCVQDYDAAQKAQKGKESALISRKFLSPPRHIKHKITYHARHSSSLAFSLAIIWGDLSLGTRTIAGMKSISIQNMQVAQTQHLIYSCLQRFPEHVKESKHHTHI